MDQTARRRRRNLIQNIAIALLSVSAVLLFAQLQLYNLGTSEDPLYLERLTGEGSPSRLREFPAPVRVVLTDSYGRYGSLGFTTNSDGFSALGLREALGSVQHLAPSTTDAFRGALSGPSIYFDFESPAPPGACRAHRCRGHRVGGEMPAVCCWPQGRTAPSISMYGTVLIPSSPAPSPPPPSP